MNFFGHAIAARWVSGSSAFTYGAMLPDLSAMVGARLSVSPSEEIARGIAFHHETDGLFHQDPTFAALESWSRERLYELGVSKGPRRALAHVGLELLLDRALAADPLNLEQYRLALLVGSELNGITRDSGADAALRALCDVLLERMVRLAPDSGSTLAERMGRVLERRPRLRFSMAEHTAVVTWGEEAMARVEALSDTWITELRQVISAQRPAVASDDGLR